MNQGRFGAALHQDQQQGDPTQSPQFKRWFGQSKVVDESGRPLPVYHGSPADFDTFDTGKISGDGGRALGSGFYFTTDRDVAAGYAEGGRIYETYLSIQNPMAYNAKRLPPARLVPFLKNLAALEAEENGTDWQDGYLSNFADTYSQSLDRSAMEAAQLFSGENSFLDQIGGLIGAGVNPTTVNKTLYKTFGYDGIISNRSTNDMAGSDESTIWVAFFPTQIKSVNNKGGWSAGDQNIHQGRR